MPPPTEAARGGRATGYAVFTLTGHSGGNFMIGDSPHFSSAERELLARARDMRAYPLLERLTSQQLEELVATEGIDLATAVLYDRLCRSPRVESFIAELDRLEQLNFSQQRMSGVLFAVSPGAFWKELPHIQADGSLLRGVAAELGCRTETIPIPTTGGLRDNAQRLLTWLRRQTAPRIVLASLSKGGADVRIALEQDPAAFSHVVAWINICGMTDGTPLADCLLESPWRKFVVRLLFWMRGFSFQMIRDLRVGLPGLVGQSLVVPEHLQLISVIGFPLTSHVKNRRATRWRKLLNPRGPNDGGVLLHDFCQLPGLLCPVWGADHYLRPAHRDLRRLTAALLLYIDNSRRTSLQRKA